MLFRSVTGWGIGSDYCDIEWFALETNRDHSVVFETASKYPDFQSGWRVYLQEVKGICQSLTAYFFSS